MHTDQFSVQYQQFFHDVQMARVFDDSKTFADAVAKKPVTEILKSYVQEKDRNTFDLKAFVLDHYDIPMNIGAEEKADNTRQQSANAALMSIWEMLTRPADPKDIKSSLINLPYPYVVPGGRFRELYYWDSYFTMLGLAEAGKVHLVEHMLDNFAFIIDEIGHIPNGTRTYYTGRSQLPLFCLMVELYAEIKSDPTIYSKYYPQLQKEYNFWMDGADGLRSKGQGHRRTVFAGDGLGILNRYWDDNKGPRPESYFEDIHLFEQSDQKEDPFYRHIRAACESGWDFSSRWCGGASDLGTIETTNILPIDLNAVMWKFEMILAKSAAKCGDRDSENEYHQKAEKRKRAIQDGFYCEKIGFFTDLHTGDMKPNGFLSLAGMFPLFFGLATQEQAENCAITLENSLLRAGGWLTTPIQSGQQWDAPNGWAPLQWIAYKGLKNYGFDTMATAGAKRWVDNNLNAFDKTGHFYEKYNVEQPEQLAGGGEYIPQTGFGWTNAVLMKFIVELKE